MKTLRWGMIDGGGRITTCKHVHNFTSCPPPSSMHPSIPATDRYGRRCLVFIFVFDFYVPIPAPGLAVVPSFSSWGGHCVCSSKGYGLEAGQMKGYWDWYLKKDKDGQHPLASPLRAKKRLLKGLPPVLLMRAEHEILWDEISEMGRNLAEAGQEVICFLSFVCWVGLRWLFVFMNVPCVGVAMTPSAYIHSTCARSVCVCMKCTKGGTRFFLTVRVLWCRCSVTLAGRCDQPRVVCI